MSTRGYVRTIPRTAFAHACAALLVILVLCPFTAPFATYSPGEVPTNESSIQGGGPSTFMCDKDVAPAAGMTDVPVLLATQRMPAIVHASSAIDHTHVRSIILRV